MTTTVSSKVSIRLDTTVRLDLARFIEAHEVTQSQAIRMLLEIGLKTVDQRHFELTRIAIREGLYTGMRMAQKQLHVALDAAFQELT